MSTIRANTILDSSGGNTAQINGMTPTAQSLQGFRNRIINGDMRIDQRNNGASVTLNNGGAAYVYTVDRWAAFSIKNSVISFQQNAGGVTPPPGFTNYLGATSLAATTVASTDITVLKQPIEAFNTADFNLGTANAVSFTVSFWVRSSLTGTFGGALSNNAVTYIYPFSFVINSANTWEYKTIAVTGPTAGTWLTGNNAGLQLFFSLGTGSTYLGTANTWQSAAGGLFAPTGSTNLIATNGATFHITGVQLEAGSVATPFERRDYGRELMMCQRYYSVQNATSSLALAISTTAARVGIQPFVRMRATPTLSRVGNLIRLVRSGTDTTQSAASFTDAGSNDLLVVTQLDNFSGLVSGGTYVLGDQAAQIGLSAEL